MSRVWVCRRYYADLTAEIEEGFQRSDELKDELHALTLPSRSEAVSGSLQPGSPSSARTLDPEEQLQEITYKMLMAEATFENPLSAGNYAQAASRVLENVRVGRLPSETGVRELHSLLYRDLARLFGRDLHGSGTVPPPAPGEYKTSQNCSTRPDGSRFHFYPPGDVPSAMRQLFRGIPKVEATFHPCIAAAWLLSQFLLIHPFPDGNGRTARLAIQQVLLRAGYGIPVIGREERSHYLEALITAHEGDLTDMIRLLLRLCIRSQEALVGEMEKRIDVPNTKGRPHMNPPIPRRVKASDGLLQQHLNDKIVFLNEVSETYFHLDRHGSRMWETLIEEGCTERALRRLLQSYEVDEETLRPDLDRFVDQLLEAGLLERMD